MTDRAGQQFGNYRLVRLLGQGGYAEVYLGKHLRLNQQAAIKVLHAHLTETEAEHFQQEAQIISTFIHPSIIRVFDYDVQDGVPFLVMDYAPNGSLRRRYQKGSPVPLAQVVSSVKQVADALQYAHEQKFIHRDVKPENMLLGRREEVLLSDFGIAAIAHSSASLSTKEAVGTLSYMAPEQIEGHPRAASDQYALGCVVYEWLCGVRPFEGSPTEVMVQQLSMPPPPLHEKVASVPMEVEQVVLRALAKDPKLRFLPSVQDFATALHHAAHQAGDASFATPAVPATATSPGSQGERAHPAAPRDTLLAEPFWKVPVVLTPLVGREQDVASICTMLSRQEVRLLILLGVGGIGKTRLAIQVATYLRNRFAEGVCFVGLAPISDPSLVISSIAHELGLQEAGAQPLFETVKACLRDKHFLLLLDNFEQIVSAAPLLEDLLTACSQLVILVTSREVLHLSTEHLFPVPALTLPDLARLPEQEDLGQYAAVSLFIQRAQALKPDFQLIPANAYAIAEICVRLDGLPLAIELAAARIRVLSPRALLARLSQRLQVLAGGSRTVPERQQTLRNTIQWSYDLLNTQEQRLFQRLSLFVGGCTLETIEAICAALDDSHEGIPVLDGVASLIDKSLLQQTEQEGEEARLVMLETIREYALERLTLNWEMEEARQAHATFYLKLAEEAEEEARQAHATFYLKLAEEAELEQRGTQSGLWLGCLEREHDNLRAVLAWSLESVQGEEIAQRRELGLRLAGALRPFWITHAHLSEGRTLLERALAASAGAATTVKAKALIAAADILLVQGDDKRGEALAEEGMVLCQEVGDGMGIAFSLYQLGTFASYRGEYARARTLLEESVALFKERNNQDRQGWSLFALAELDSRLGEHIRARAHFEEALALFREVGDKEGMAEMLEMIAQELFLSQGDLVTARSMSDEGLVLAREVGNKWLLAFSLNISAELALIQNEITTARELLEESVAIFQEIDLKYGLAEALSILARVEAHQGNDAAARRLAEESLTLAGQENKKMKIPLYLETLAEVVAVQGEKAWAVRLWGTAQTLREAMNMPLPPVYCTDHERAIAASRTQLGEQAFAIAWAEGRTMTLEQVLTASERAVMPSQTSTVQPERATTKTSPGYPAGLTSREVEVLRLVARGLTDAQVAAQLEISPRTVNTHLTSIYNKLGIDSRTAATRFAVDHQLV